MKKLFISSILLTLFSSVPTFAGDDGPSAGTNKQKQRSYCLLESKHFNLKNLKLESTTFSDEGDFIGYDYSGGLTVLDRQFDLIDGESKYSFHLQVFDDKFFVMYDVIRLNVFDNGELVIASSPEEDYKEDNSDTLHTFSELLYAPFYKGEFRKGKMKAKEQGLEGEERDKVIKAHIVEAAKKRYPNATKILESVSVSCNTDMRSRSKAD